MKVDNGTGEISYHHITTSCARYSCVQPFDSLLRLVSRPNAWKSSRLSSWYHIKVVASLPGGYNFALEIH